MAPFKEAQPCRDTDDKKAKLPKSEHKAQPVSNSYVIFLDLPRFVWKTCARRNRLVAKLRLYFVSSPLNK